LKGGFEEGKVAFGRSGRALEDTKTPSEGKISIRGRP
jgi:hypothetical protein